MDSWSDKQIRTMRVGGNKKMNDFFAKHGVPIKVPNRIREKYDNPVAEYYREVIEAKRDDKPGPTRPVPAFQEKKKPSAANSNSGDDSNLSAQERYERHKRMEAEARERMRAKFGKSGGLGSGSFGTAGIGSNPNYRPGQNNNNSASASDWFAKVSVDYLFS